MLITFGKCKTVFWRWISTTLLCAKLPNICGSAEPWRKPRFYSRIQCILFTDPIYEAHKHFLNVYLLLAPLQITKPHIFIVVLRHQMLMLLKCQNGFISIHIMAQFAWEPQILWSWLTNTDFLRMLKLLCCWFCQFANNKNVWTEDFSSEIQLC